METDTNIDLSKEIANHETMDYAINSLFFNGNKKVSIHGNEFCHKGTEPTLEINGKSIKGIYKIKLNRPDERDKEYLDEMVFESRGSDYNNIKVNFFDSNNKKYTFTKPDKFVIDKDFLLKEVELPFVLTYGKKPEGEKPFELLYLSIFGRQPEGDDDESYWLSSAKDSILMQNYYLFDENKNIVYVAQIPTLDIGTRMFISGKAFKEYKDLTSEERARVELLNKINSEAVKMKAMRFFVVFNGNNAYVLIGNQLYFYEKKGESFEKTKILKNDHYEDAIFDLSKITGVEDDTGYPRFFLTTFEDKIFVAYDGYQKSGILVFNKNTKGLESDIKIPSCSTLDELRDYLRRLNPRDLTVHLSEWQFDIERKRYFDKCVQKKADKKKEEELNKKNNESKKEDKKEDKINNDKKEDEKDENNNKNNNKTEVKGDVDKSLKETHGKEKGSGMGNG